MSETPAGEHSGDKTVCSECGMPTQCAACYLMEQAGHAPPPRVFPSAETAEGSSDE